MNKTLPAGRSPASHQAAKPHRKSHSSNCERRALPAILVTNERGTKRSASTANQLVQPEITLGFCWRNPRSAVSTTSSGVWIVRIGGRSIFDAAKQLDRKT